MREEQYYNGMNEQEFYEFLKEIESNPNQEITKNTKAVFITTEKYKNMIDEERETGSVFDRKVYMSEEELNQGIVGSYHGVSMYEQTLVDKDIIVYN